MTYAELLTMLGQQLEEVGEERLALELAFRHIKGWTKTDLILQQRSPVSEQDKMVLEYLFKNLATHKPYQYLIGQAEFRDLVLKVDERVLIPRPETEELVDLILSENSSNQLSVLDIGTGSGAIALSLKQAKPTWQVTAADISKDAIDLARENANDNHLEVSFVQSDVFTQITGQFDIIVSNPPYISYEDKDEVGINVLTSEPHLALFAEEDGYQIYRRIIEQASNFLTPNGKIYFEIGYKQGEIVKRLLKKHFPNKKVRVLQDCFGKDRMVVASE